MEQYFLKFFKDGKSVKHTIVDESTDVLGLRGIRLGGVVFDETNIVTVSGVNSLENTVTELSGASSIGDDLLQGQIDSISSFVDGVSSSSDDNDQLLQNQIDAIVNDFAIEERFVVSGGQTTINLSAFTFDPSGNVRDIQVFKNTSKVFQSVSGDSSDEKLGGDFVKNSDSEFEFLYPLADGDKIIVRKERTGGSGGTGGVSGAVDLENITVDPSPSSNGSQSLGNSVKAWESLYIKDVTNSNIYQIQVSGGVLQAISV